MELTIALGEHRYAVNLDAPHDISIPVRFEGEQISLFGSPPARREAYATEGFTGDVKQGGSCNCDTLIFSPHLSGTHTECVGHITREPHAVCNLLKDSFIAATLVTIPPQEAGEAGESYDPALRPGDRLITRAALENALEKNSEAFLKALVIRTLPNGPEKTTQDYSRLLPPFFSIEAMRFINELGVKHLVADIPSIDRLDDEGKLTNHHIFWGLPPGGHAADAKNPSPKTVTELVYVHDSISDGHYMLNLQLAPLVTDAAPSRPLLYTVSQL